LSAESFELFSQEHVSAKLFGQTDNYGYGIGVDQVHGHKILLHTGGMVSFMSSLCLDLDAGIGAFASINAQQQYRPTPVTQYAIQLVSAASEHRQLPSAADLPDPSRVANSADYAGRYKAPDGRALQFIAEGERLVLLHKGTRVAVESSGRNFTALHPDFALFPLVFGRESLQNRDQVAEVAYGPDWYAGAEYSGARNFAVPEPYHGFAGHYRNEDPWIRSLRIILRKDRLWIDGVVPLEPIGDGIFRLNDKPFSPETIRFLHVVDGKARMIKFSGQDLWRAEAM
jgi:hypothetical protein